MAPHLVRPLSFLLPVYEGDARSLTKIRLGVTLYDWLTSDHDGLPPHQTLSAAEAIAAEPALAGDGLQGAVRFYDCQMDDARLCIETIADACRQGAVCANYCRATGFRREWDRLVGLQALDEVSANNFEVRARLFVNATGPWVESIAKLATQSASAITLSPTKGVHLVVPRVNREHGIYFQARSDRRMIFLLPWDDASLLGTTDTDFDRDPRTANADGNDVEYLLNQLRLCAPDVSVGESDVITSFAGVRALIRSNRRRPSSRSREERIVRHNTNLLSIAGGKYTTFRAISEKAVDTACRMLGVRRTRCRTRETPLPQLRPTSAGECLADAPSVYASDVTHGCHTEMPVTLSDLMRRRTRLALSRHGAESVARKVCDLMAAELLWSDATKARMLAAYLGEWNASRDLK
jgi:glycerol-3-phosphate dehydrogenase